MSNQEYKRHIQIEEREHSTLISIPSRQISCFTIVYGIAIIPLLFMIISYITPDEVPAADQSYNPICGLLPVIILGVFVIYKFLWGISGKELLEINAEHLKASLILIGPFKQSRQYEVKNIQNIRIVPKAQYENHITSHNKGFSKFIPTLYYTSTHYLIFDENQVPVIIGLGKIDQNDISTIFEILKRYTEPEEEML